MSVLTLVELQEDLASVRTAIRRIEGGAYRYTIGSQTYEQHDLSKLYAREKFLIQQISTHPDGVNRGLLSHSQAIFGGRR